MRFLIDFLDTVSKEEITNYFQTNNCTLVKEWDNYSKVFLVEAPSTPARNELTQRVAAENLISVKLLDVIPVNSYYQTHRDPSFDTITVNINENKDWWKNFSYAQPEFVQPTLTLSRLGENMTVYMMDSGIERSHPEFANANITNLYSVTPNDFNDYTGHGTALSSVVVGATCGITDAKLKVVKIFDPTHDTLESDLLDALDAIINDHVDNTFSFLNCSWSIAKNDWVEHKLRVLQNEGIIVLAAAGNSGIPIEDVTPASMIEVVTVGAYNKDLKPCDFSNYTGGSITSLTTNQTNHGELDGWAPGEEIWVAGLNGTYGYVAGTSIATAIATAIAASDFSWWANSDGTRTKSFEDMTMSTAVLNSPNYIFSRFNLLDLDDPKYAVSNNAVATIGSKDAGKLRNPVDQFYHVVKVNTSGVIERVLDPGLTQSYEFINPLPENFEILPDGRLYGSPTVAQGPAVGEQYKEYIVKFNRNLLNGITELVTINLYILGEDFEPNALPDDNIVKIKFLLPVNSCTGPVQACQIGSIIESCVNQCSTPGGCCNGGFKTSLTCTCL